ncbi:hypothetical protein [Stenotrophomonas maltophilia]|uniref:hypothetical protein n=1 Tax=Stenotrophomonas maltophilia TaxID=40324 RepID=UPI002E78D853|nr:hypothetical protein [Stenotrophomonas maltophilia]
MSCWKRWIYVKKRASVSEGLATFIATIALLMGIGLGMAIVTGGDAPFACLEKGNAADWVAAIAAGFAAVATIVIGRVAQKFTREAETARRREFREASLRDEAAVATQRADAQERLARENEVISARLLVMRGTARKARYPRSALKQIFGELPATSGDEGGSGNEAASSENGGDPPKNESFRYSESSMALQLEMTIAYIDAMNWSEDFKTALDEECIKALYVLERQILWYRAVTTPKISSLRAAAKKNGDERKNAEKKVGGKRFDALNDKRISLIRQIADDLADASEKFTAALEARRERYV